MSEIYIKSSEAVIKLEADNEEVIEDIINDEFFTSYIPSVCLARKEDVKSFDAHIIVKQTNNNNIKINYPEVLFEYDILNTKDVISLTEFIFERARQEKGIICIHGAGAIVNDKLVTCWGTTTGMGKTSLALNLSKEDNASFYSDEKILIDLKNKKSVGRIMNQYISNNYWKDIYGKENFHKQDNLSNKDSYEIGPFVEVILCDQDKYIYDKWDNNKFIWHLYEESSRKIRGTSRVFFNNTFPVQSLDTDKLSSDRLELIKDFTKNIPAVYFKGKYDDIKNIINKTDY